MLGSMIIGKRIKGRSGNSCDEDPCGAPKTNEEQPRRFSLANLKNCVPKHLVDDVTTQNGFRSIPSSRMSHSTVSVLAFGVGIGMSRLSSSNLQSLIESQGFEFRGCNYNSEKKVLIALVLRYLDKQMHKQCRT